MRSPPFVPRWTKTDLGDTGILALTFREMVMMFSMDHPRRAGLRQFGDHALSIPWIRRTRAALRELRQDVAQGADMVMVKPGLAYLDVIARIRAELARLRAVVAYNVSGEYAMVKAGRESKGWIDGAAMNRAALEIVTSIRRAGADLIITYHAVDIAR